MESKFIEVAKKAADWWVKKIKEGPEYIDLNGNPSNHHGDPKDDNYLMTQLVVAEKRGEMKEQNLIHFYESLVKKIDSALNEKGIFLIKSDYAPVGELAKLCIESEVPSELIPWKTYMKILDGKVTVKHGSHAMYMTIE